MEIRDSFPELQTMEHHQLLTLREQILSKAVNGDFRSLPDDDLNRLFCISRTLKRKAANGSATKTPRAPKPKKAVSADDLA